MPGVINAEDTNLANQQHFIDTCFPSGTALYAQNPTVEENRQDMLKQAENPNKEKTNRGIKCFSLTC